MHVEVLRVVDVFVGAGEDAVDDAGLEVEEDGAGDVARVVGLVEEDVFAVAGPRGREAAAPAGGVGGGEVGEVAVLVYAVFEAELLPEL